MNKLTPEAEVFEKYADWKGRRSILRMVITPEEINKEVAELLKAQGLFTREWFPSSLLPPLGVEVTGFSIDWIDEDYNPNGTRTCFISGNVDAPDWSSAKWCNTNDCYETDSSAPTHWMPLPPPPIQSPKNHEG